MTYSELPLQYRIWAEKKGFSIDSAVSYYQQGEEYREYMVDYLLKVMSYSNSNRELINELLVAARGKRVVYS